MKYKAGQILENKSTSAGIYDKLLLIEQVRVSSAFSKMPRWKIRVLETTNISHQNLELSEETLNEFYKLNVKETFKNMIKRAK